VIDRQPETRGGLQCRFTIGRAFQEFLDKSIDFIREGVHLLIIDLFPPTKRDPHGVHRAFRM
jgi:hypothetical protein